MSSSYIIPTNIINVTGPTTNGAFLLLNNEIHNDTFIIGFEFYSVSNGSILLKVS